jgi:hypothetical protein
MGNVKFCTACRRDRSYPDGWNRIFAKGDWRFVDRCAVCVQKIAEYNQSRVEKEEDDVSQGA